MSEIRDEDLLLTWRVDIFIGAWIDKMSKTCWISFFPMSVAADTGRGVKVIIEEVDRRRC